MNELPTIKDIDWNSKYDEKQIDEVLLAHEAHAEEMMIRAGKKLVEEQFKDSTTFAKNKQEFDYWKGAYERLQALKGEVKK
jgi:hypothetical protein